MGVASMIEHAALLATVTPGIVGFVLYAFSRRLRRGVGWIATIAAFSSVIMLISIGKDVMERQEPLIFSYGWIRSIDVDFGFLVDMISFPIALIAAAVSTLCCFYSINYMEKERDQPAYYANLLLFMTGMVGVILSSNLIQFYLFWELMLIPSYLLIANWGTSKNRLNIAFKYFIFTHIGALSMLLGILAIFSYTGTFNLLKLADPLDPLSPVRAIPSSMVGVIFVMLLIGFLVKMAAFPFHTWLPDAHSEAPTPISAMLSGIMIKCGAYGMARVLLTTFGQIVLQVSDYLAILGIITIAYGGLMALAQTDIKRLFAYSSISQMGYIIFGLGVASELGIRGGILHIINHAVCKSLLFMCAGIIIHQTGTRDIRRLGGLIGKMPTMGIACLIGVFSLVGTPPLNAFWSEWMIFGGGLAAGKGLITIFGVLSTVITAGYYLWFAWRVFFGPVPKRLNRIKEAPLSLRASVIILATISVVLGVLPGLVLEYVTPAAEYLFRLLPGLVGGG